MHITSQLQDMLDQVRINSKPMISDSSSTERTSYQLPAAPNSFLFSVVRAGMFLREIGPLRHGARRALG
jgi:hypothetical protein